ncbi:aminoglycoside phosphotransferase family protein [Sphingobacterium sp. SGG-5]|uniref:phosphotransferase enzyme family protein n=1 Tax=Sphingobacterium sp. SGG-5 TaxID=2710881 RepID=UPI0013ECA314|nr:aminoglycoside phosphotransferase family protein [Sphingobacterium sp. SGG-5]NGM61636.1 aminoglycoside phosphotransferase family protein [Sphingobacterium sp. SGG-5]
MSLVSIEKTIKVIANQFDVEGEVLDISRFGSGHINDTYKLTVSSSKDISYLLQKINHHIFTDVDGLMHNISLVTNHLKTVLKGTVGDVDKHTLTIVPTKENGLYHVTSDGEYWRIFILLEDTKSYDIVETTKQAYSGGQAFGKFQKQLATLDATKLVEILPNFHNIDFRLNNLRKAISKDSAGRVAAVEDILIYIFERENKMRRILELAKSGQLPLRITHNDTKFNNVLLDQYDNVQCVIDLDTVMPGYVAYDFGDAIRTIINAAAEDEEDLDKVVLNIPLFQAYAEGYLNEAKEFLTNTEIDSLMYGVLLLPYMQAVRFLTDYLEDDIYYKIHYPEHNLVRTKAQLKLVQELESHEEILTNILNKSLVSQ